MSKANQRRIDCFHESGHAVMAWVEGVTIFEMRLVPDHEGGKHSATTSYDSPGAKPEEWTLSDIVAHMRIAMAGPVAEQQGPAPVSAFEREFAKLEETQHLMQAVQVIQQFGANRINDDDIPILAESARQDVIAVFSKTYVTQCVKTLALELLRDKSISGPDAEALIAGRITHEQRNSLRLECCLTGARLYQRAQRELAGEPGAFKKPAILTAGDTPD
jgi:hypothetical protein